MNPFAGLKHARPRLLATAGIIARMRSLIREDRTAAKWFGELASQAEKIVALPPLNPDWVHDPSETAGTALPLKAQMNFHGPALPLDTARLFVLRILTLGIVWFATENNKYRDRLKIEVFWFVTFRIGSATNSWSLQRPVLASRSGTTGFSMTSMRPNEERLPTQS